MGALGEMSADSSCPHQFTRIERIQEIGRGNVIETYVCWWCGLKVRREWNVFERSWKAVTDRKDEMMVEKKSRIQRLAEGMAMWPNSFGAVRCLSFKMPDGAQVVSVEGPDYASIVRSLISANTFLRVFFFEEQLLRTVEVARESTHSGQYAVDSDVRYRLVCERDLWVNVPKTDNPKNVSAPEVEMSAGNADMIVRVSKGPNDSCSVSYQRGRVVTAMSGLPSGVELTLHVDSGELLVTNRDHEVIATIDGVSRGRR